jgi:DNA repair photolyase
MPRPIQAKTILSSVRPGSDTWFGLRYNMNLYRGCQHGCIYCDSRSNCYQLGELSDIRLKENALELLEIELKSKRNKGTIGFGSMNDPYMPVEADEQYTRRALQLALKYRFPVHIITKSNLVIRDIDVLRDIGKIYAAISLTITTIDDRLSKVTEPNAPLSSLRFDAIKQLSDAGIYCGVMLMPVLPFITDTQENIEGIIYKAKESGAKYILAVMGMTLREGQREYYYQQLDRHFPGLKEKYTQLYGNRYSYDVPEAKKLWYRFQTICNAIQMPTKMKFYKDEEDKQLKLF